MKTYKFKYKRRFFWHSIKAIGHRYYADVNKVDVFHEDGSITSIPKFSECYLRLGTDWVLFTKREIEKESGQQVQLNTDMKE